MHSQICVANDERNPLPYKTVRVTLTREKGYIAKEEELSKVDEEY